MKRLLSLFIAMSAVLCLSAQDSVHVVRFGYLNYQQALQSMPQYALVKKKMADLRNQYEADLKSMHMRSSLKGSTSFRRPFFRNARPNCRS